MEIPPFRGSARASPLTCEPSPTSRQSSSRALPSPAPPAAEPGWCETNEAVRDLHRSLLPSRHAGGAQTHGDVKLARNLRLHPELPSASELAQPGGFRRAHVIETLPADSGAVAYAMRPLAVHLEARGFTRAFVTDVVQVLEDGTELRYESRQFRRGRRPEVKRRSSEPTDAKPRRQRLRFCGWRPRSVNYWVSLNFLAGGFLFTVGSIDWMLPRLGDRQHGATAVAISASVGYPYFVGAITFVVGCYLALVEVLNANLQEEIKAVGGLDPDGSILRTVSRASLPTHDGRDASLLPRRSSGEVGDGAAERGCVRRLRWCGVQPGSLLWWASFSQLVGAILFQVACTYTLPFMPDIEDGERWLVWWPSVVGSVTFVFASYVYVTEVTHTWNPFWVEQMTIGYAVVRRRRPPPCARVCTRHCTRCIFPAPHS